MIAQATDTSAAGLPHVRPDRATISLEVAPEAYDLWRATTLGRITEAIETALVFEVTGDLQERRVLDVGTGDGSYAIAARARGADVVGIDPVERMLAAAQARASSHDFDMTLVRGRGEAIPFMSESFGVVLAVTALCFVPDAGRAVREMARVLVPGGRLVVGELGRCSVWAALRRIRAWRGDRTWRHARFWSRRELRELAEGAGLRAEAVHGAVHYPPLAVAARALGPADRLLRRLHAPGAAFLVLSARKRLDSE